MGDQPHLISCTQASAHGFLDSVPSCCRRRGHSIFPSGIAVDKRKSVRVCETIIKLVTAQRARDSSMYILFARWRER